MDTTQGHRRSTMAIIATGVSLALWGVGGGCRAAPYRLGTVSDYVVSAELAPLTEPPVELGRRMPALDTIGWVIGIPSKIILWDRRVDNHAVSTETVAAIEEYLAFNELDTVKVRVNQYAPGAEWRRLVENKSVGWGWRYTAGTLTWLGETVFPGRVWGGDHFNPFTNTVHLYSDVPAVALHEAGHAKDFARRTWKGTYAVAYTLPVVPLWHEAIATRDALGYLRLQGDTEGLQEGYRILYPAYGTYVGGAVGEFLPGPDAGWIAYAAAVIPAHVVGRIQAARVGAESGSLEPASSLPPPTEASPVGAARPEAAVGAPAPDHWNGASIHPATEAFQPFALPAERSATVANPQVRAVTEP